MLTKDGIINFLNEKISFDSFSYWAFWVASLVIGGVTGQLFYKYSYQIFTHQKYSLFSVSDLAWKADVKLPDYALFFGVVFGFILAFLLIAYVCKLFEKRFGKGAVDKLHKVTIYSLIPFAIWFGSRVFSKEFDMVYINLSAALILMVLALTTAYSYNKGESLDLSSYENVIVNNLSAIFASIFSFFAILLTISRLSITFDANITNLRLESYFSTGLPVLVIFLALAFLRGWVFRPADQRRFFRRALIISQLFLPLLFLIILPTPWASENGVKYYGYPINTSLWLFIVTLIIITYIDLVRRYISKDESLLSAISPLSLIAIIVYIKSPIVDTPYFARDDYHFGENLLPLWLWKKFGIIPGWDYSPSRGLINCVDGAVSSVFFDGTVATTISAIKPVLAAIYAIIFFFIFSMAVGHLPAFVILLFLPRFWDKFELNMIIIAAVLLLGALYKKLKPSAWLLVYCYLSVFLVLFTTGQGGLFVIATIPVGIYQMMRAWKSDKKKLATSAVIFIASLLFLSIFLPLPKMIAGAVRYGIEQSSINTEAYGISLRYSAIEGKPVNNKFLFDIMRSLFIIIPLIISVILLKMLKRDSKDGDSGLWVYVLPFFIYLILFVFRAAGRVSPIKLDYRLGIPSLVFVSALVPVLIFLFTKKRRAAFLFAAYCFVGAYFPLMEYVPAIEASSYNNNPFKKRYLEQSAEIPLTPGKSIGLPNIGNIFLLKEEGERLTAINSVLNHFLTPDETYLDMTNRNAMYFYLDRRVPLESGAFFNIVSKQQQLRAVEKLKAERPPVALIDAENLFFDGGSAAHRSNPIYRYLLMNYIPVKINGYGFMITPERLSKKLKGYDMSKASDNKLGMQILNDAFGRYNNNLYAIPAAWGQSFNELLDEMTFVSNLDTISASGGLALNKTGTYKLTGDNVPYIYYSVSDKNITGADAGLLTFDLKFDGIKGPADFVVYWDTSPLPSPSKARSLKFSGYNGKNIVPLDVSPNWLLSGRISYIGIRFKGYKGAKNLSITNIQLFQRKTSEAVGKNFTRFNYPGEKYTIRGNDVRIQ